MAFNGSGTFNRVHNWVNDKNAGIDITASRMDSEFDGIATGLSTCITKDGQTTITANLPMAGFKHTGVGTGSSKDDYADVLSVQKGTYVFDASASGTSAIALALSPVVSSLPDGQNVLFRAPGNIVDSPNIVLNGLSSKALVDFEGSAITSGVITSGQPVIAQFLSSPDQYYLQNYPSFLKRKAGEYVLNDDGLDINTRIEGGTDQSLFHLDAGNDDAGFGTSTTGIAKVAIKQNGTQLFIEQSNNQHGFLITVDDADGHLGFLREQSGATERFTIQAGGNVFIPTSDASFGVGISSANSSAIIQADSTSKGFLPPRMTSTQRDGISSPPEGLVVGNTTDNTLDYYDGTSWVPLTGVVQQVYTEDAAVATGSTGTPVDDTIPQNSEGTEFITQAITPKNSNNQLVIEATLFVGSTNDTDQVVALFQDTTADALFVAIERSNTATDIRRTIKFTYRMQAGTTSSTTFKIRIGQPDASQLTFNGWSGSRGFGTAAKSNIMITEIAA